MKVNYNLKDRKSFVKALEEITGAKAVYMKLPTYAYRVDYFTVTREGNLTFDDMADSAEIERVLGELGKRGFTYESSEYDNPQPEPEMETEEPLEDCPPQYETPETEIEEALKAEPEEALEKLPPAEEAPESETEKPSEDCHTADEAPKPEIKEAFEEQPHADEVPETEPEEALEELSLEAEAPEPETEHPDSNEGLTVSVPIETVQMENLKNLLASKGRLIKKALGISELPLEITEEQVSFPWFSAVLDADTVRAYTELIEALCRMSREQKRISGKERPVENEKYAFRCLLLRLGFIGPEHKNNRKILLQNLTGSSAFKSGAKKEAAENEISE